MDIKKFYDSIRSRLTLTDKNVKGFDFIIHEALKRNINLFFLSYALATVWHETAATMQPIAEYGKGKGKKYGKPGKYKQAPYGRGYVQLTWDYNYERADKELNLGGTLLKDFNKAMDPEIAVQVLFTGMLEGWFTGKALDDYIDTLDETDTEDLREFTNARRIINGTDKQALIGQYALVFERALKDAEYPLDGIQKPVEAIVVVPAVVVPELTKTSVEASMAEIQQEDLTVSEAFKKLLEALFKKG